MKSLFMMLIKVNNLILYYKKPFLIHIVEFVRSAQYLINQGMDGNLTMLLVFNPRFIIMVFL